jgi:hypothetical protein
MALNFSRCVTIFGSSWSEARPHLLAFSACRLLGRTGRSRRTRRRHLDCRNLRGQKVPGAWHPKGHRRRGCQGRRRTTQSEQREGQTPSVQPASNFKERRLAGGIGSQQVATSVERAFYVNLIAPSLIPVAAAQSNLDRVLSAHLPIAPYHRPAFRIDISRSLARYPTDSAGKFW